MQSGGFGQPRGYKSNEVNPALVAKYIASAFLQGSARFAEMFTFFHLNARKLGVQAPQKVKFE